MATSEETIIDFNFTNMITVFIMVAVGILGLGIVIGIIQKISGKGGGSTNG